jgi:trimethylamine:corrinoid methyltransferase-like protein
MTPKYRPGNETWVTYRPTELPTQMVRQPWDVWEAAGSKTATDRIPAKLNKTLARHTPPALPKGAAEQIAAVLREAEARNSKR